MASGEPPARVCAVIRRGAIALVLAIVLPTCALATPSATPTPPVASRLLAGQPMSSCSLQGTQALCGTLRVPEDPSNPAGRAIDLRVAVIPAVEATPKSDPVFWLSGGSGGAATEAEVPYVLSTSGLTHEEFWDIANGLHPNQI